MPFIVVETIHKSVSILLFEATKTIRRSKSSEQKHVMAGVAIMLSKLNLKCDF